MSGFVGTGETGRESHNDNLELSENSEFTAGGNFWFCVMIYPIHIFRDTWDHAQKAGWKVCVSAYEAYQVLRMCFKS